MLSFFVVLQIILVVAVILLVLFQNSNVDLMSSFTKNAPSSHASVNVKPVQNPLGRLTWIVSFIFFLNTITLSKVMYYQSGKMAIDKVSHIEKPVSKEEDSVALDELPFGNE